MHPHSMCSKINTLHVQITHGFYRIPETVYLPGNNKFVILFVVIVIK